jgi:hypothetical protein
MQMSSDNPVAFHCAVLQFVLFGDERRHFNCPICGHRARTVANGTEQLPGQGNSTVSQLGPTGTTKLSAIHFTEYTLVMVTNAQTDIYTPWHSEYQQHSDNSPRMNVIYAVFLSLWETAAQ